MERLLTMRLESVGLAAEASLNGVPLLRTAPGGGAVSCPVHEYVIAGGNEVELTVLPPSAKPGEAPVPEPWLADGRSAASLRLLLPRVGQRAHPEFARTVGAVDWALPAGEAVELPARQRRVVELPIGFPRWRWLDAPVVDDPAALQAAAAAFLQPLVLGLQRGDPEPLVQAARLRFEEMAQAYQRPLAELVNAFRATVASAHAAQPLKLAMPTAASLRLRAVAGGRLLECQDDSGQPTLRAARSAVASLSWPLRLAAIEGRFYVLR